VTVPVKSKRCENCGSERPGSEKFCDECGHRISELRVSHEPNHKACPKCGSSRDVAERYCGGCGQSFIDGAENEPFADPVDGAREVAIDLVNRRRYQDALPILRQVLERNPDDWNCWYLAGQCCRFLEDFDGAGRCCIDRIRLDMPSARSLSVSDRLRFRRSEFDHAIEYFAGEPGLDSLIARVARV
jgi:tetratricopeptide (TPR) repeat protein